MINLASSLSKFESDLWGYHLPIPASVVEELSEGTDRRVLCTIQKKVTINSSFMPSGDVWFILVNKELRTKLNLSLGQEVSVSLVKDTSEYGMPMPEVFGALLGQDQQGSDYFHALTPGKQRSLIYIVSKVKNIDSRLNKSLAILDHLKAGEGKLDFKQLNMLIKEYNQRGKLKL